MTNTVRGQTVEVEVSGRAGVLAHGRGPLTAYHRKQRGFFRQRNEDFVLKFESFLWK